MNREDLEFSLPAGATRLMKALAIVGGMTFLVGTALAPQRAWPDFLLASYFLLQLSLGGIFFVALQYITGSGWSVALRRVPEAMAALLPVGAIGLGLALLLHPSLYPWTSRAGEVGFLGFKRTWLNFPFFLARSVIYLFCWVAFTFAIVRTSRRQDLDGDVAHTHRNVRLSAAFMVVFGITFSLASFDWMMSLEPRWYSTIFGIYNFAGLFLGGLAALIVLAVWTQRLAPLQTFVTEGHLHDLGKLLFAFSTFWAYIWFCQYMLVWYVNIPEETVYFVRRLHGFWEPLFLLNFMLNWGVPFLALLPRAVKRSPSLLVKVSVVVLVGRWLDLYLMVLPPFAGSRPVLGIWELGMMAGAAGLFGWLFFQTLRKAPLVPIKDPYFLESLHHHV